MNEKHRVGSVADLVNDVLTGRTSATDVARSAMAAIVNGESGPARLNAFVSFDYEDALLQAELVDRRLHDLRASRAMESVATALPLAGLPVAIKDNICTLGLPTTCGSRILAGYRSPYEATVVRKLRAAGAIITGKTNLDEFGMGSSTEHSAFGPTVNPHDPERVPGGSSGGSAAAVAAGMVPVALGSETGGSVRQPAAFCGVVGIKPSYGRVSRYGLVAFASSLDQVGVFGRSVHDAALVLRIIAGSDPRDATSASVAVDDYAAACNNASALPLDGVVIGVPDEYYPPELDPRVKESCDGALHLLRRLGATVKPVTLPHTRHAVATYYLIAPAEASSNLSRFDGIRYGVRAHGVASTQEVYERSRSSGLGPEVKRRIMLGTYALAAGYYDEYYRTAQRVRTLIERDFATVFASGVHLLFTPTTPTPAFRLGEKTGDPYSMYLSDVFTVTANLAALPALSLPVGLAGGLPVGGQFIAPRWCESAMIGAAAALEGALQQ
ncbi:Asp-tRNA(Asn)/Glu-tRNA(Gln) amidotransferase subunit GatA [soil metagenome]